MQEPLKIVTDTLGFKLEIEVTVEEMDIRGRHKTFEQEDGKVSADVIHKVSINPNLSGDELSEVVAHEAYHVFYSMRHLIVVDEETEAEVFGQLVKHIQAYVEKVNLIK